MPDIAQVVSLDRAGDLKAELVASAWGSRYSSALRRAVRERFGGVVTDEHDFINFFDHFILQQRQSDGRTVLEQFLARDRSHSEPERTLMGSWRDVVEGIFEVHDRDGSVAVVVSLLDELTYRVHATAGPEAIEPLTCGAYLVTRLIPYGEEWLLSGAQAVLPASDRPRVLRSAADLAVRAPHLVYRNPDKLARAWELQRSERERFVEFFGADLIVFPGAEMARRMRCYWEWRWPRDRHGVVARNRPMPSSLLELPAGLEEAATVGVIYDEVEGLTYLADYGLLEAIFRDLTLLSSRKHRKTLVSYLDDDSVSTLPFRRLAAQDTDKASRLFQRLLARPSFSWDRDGERLLRMRKPGCFRGEPQPSVLPLSEFLGAHLAS